MNNKSKEEKKAEDITENTIVRASNARIIMSPKKA
jgi:hypothetical protein